MGRSGRPRGAAWEVMLVDLARVRGVDLRGKLVVADGDTGQIRHVAAVPVEDDLLDQVRRAVAPEDPSLRAGRPRVFRVQAAQRSDFAPVARALGGDRDPRHAADRRRLRRPNSEASTCIPHAPIGFVRPTTSAPRDHPRRRSVRTRTSAPGRGTT